MSRPEIHYSWWESEWQKLSRWFELIECFNQSQARQFQMPVEIAADYKVRDGQLRHHSFPDELRWCIALPCFSLLALWCLSSFQHLVLILPVDSFIQSASTSYSSSPPFESSSLGWPQSQLSELRDSILSWQRWERREKERKTNKNYLESKSIGSLLCLARANSLGSRFQMWFLFWFRFSFAFLRIKLSGIVSPVSKLAWTGEFN